MAPGSLPAAALGRPLNAARPWRHLQRPWGTEGPCSHPVQHARWRRTGAEPPPPSLPLVAAAAADGEGAVQAEKQREEQPAQRVDLHASPQRPPAAVNGHGSAAAWIDKFTEPAAARPPLLGAPPLGGQVVPDLVLPPPLGGGNIYVFGCAHGDSESPHMAQFILEHRPHSVVVETGVNTWHGSERGNTLCREEALRMHNDSRTRGWAQLGVQLEGQAEIARGGGGQQQQQQRRQTYNDGHRRNSSGSEGNHSNGSTAGGRRRYQSSNGGDSSKAVEGDLGFSDGAPAFQLPPPPPLESPLWHDLSYGEHRLWSEHLAYVAAFAVDAQVVFGDRPKRITYHRLLWCPSVEDLDAAYGMQSALNYHELVSTLRPFTDVGNTSCVHRVLFLERDATLLSTLHEASLRAGPGGCVVGVVGASHLAGMRHLWEGGRWREVLAGGEALQMPDVEAVRSRESVEWLGVRWALFRAVLRLTCRPDVINDVRAVVGPVPPSLKHVYRLAAEVYGSSRMLLAVLDRDQLAEVCCGWHCDMYQKLAPVRAVRPVNGGPGYDEELVLQLRTMQFDIE